MCATESEVLSMGVSEQTAVLLHEVLQRTLFYRDARRARVLLADLRKVLERLREYGPDDLLRAWQRAGIDAPEESLFVKGWCDTFGALPQEAAGFLWALEQFEAVVKCNT